MYSAYLVFGECRSTVDNLCEKGLGNGCEGKERIGRGLCSIGSSELLQVSVS